jgi:hypothetical protein
MALKLRNAHGEHLANIRRLPGSRQTSAPGAGILRSVLSLLANGSH